MKNLILNVAGLALSLTVVLGSCQKETVKKSDLLSEEIAVAKKSISTDIEFSYSYDETVNILTGQDLKNTLSWKQRNQNGVETTIGDISYDYSDLGSMEFVEILQNSVTIKTDMGAIKFLIAEQTNSTLSLSTDISGGRTLNLELLDPTSSILNISSNFDVGDIIILDDQVAAIWPLVYAAAALVALGVDAYCDSVIATGAANCTAQGSCTVVNSCSVTCVAC